MWSSVILYMMFDMLSTSSNDMRCRACMQYNWIVTNFHLFIFRAVWCPPVAETAMARDPNSRNHIGHLEEIDNFTLTFSHRQRRPRVDSPLNWANKSIHQFMRPISFPFMALCEIVHLPIELYSLTCDICR